MLFGVMLRAALGPKHLVFDKDTSKFANNEILHHLRKAFGGSE